VLYVNANDVPWTGALAENTGQRSGGRSLYLNQCAVCHRDNRAGSPPQFPSLLGLAARRSPEEIASVIRSGKGRMPSFAAFSNDQIQAVIAYLLHDGAENPPGSHAAAPPGSPRETVPEEARYRFTGYNKFLDPDGYPAVVPPWGTLNAINLNTGEYQWRIPLGEYPELAATGLKDTGSENYGGPIVTAGGLVFIAATNFDKKLRAFDKDSGKLLWEADLPFAGNATPASYEIGGRQYVVIAAGGGKALNRPTGGVYVAFALPSNPPPSP
jgi:quinoprotein glucose dehydrogenase